jgi:hypothetical protein
VKNLFYILIPILAFLAYWFFFRKKSEGSGSEKEWRQPTSGVKVSEVDFLKYLESKQSTVQGQTHYFPQYQLEHRNKSGMTVTDAIKSGYRQVVMASKKKGDDLELTNEIKDFYIDAVANEYKIHGDAHAAVWRGAFLLRSHIQYINDNIENEEE